MGLIFLENIREHAPNSMSPRSFRELSGVLRVVSGACKAGANVVMYIKKDVTFGFAKNQNEVQKK